MKFAGQFILSFTAIFLMPLVGRADELAMSANPYSSIVERNIFALVPIPTNPPVADTPPVDPPLKITPNGIMMLFGKLEVLFKVTTKPQAGQPPKDVSHMMAEGEREDEIAVIKIDDKAGIVTFDNHGLVQELPLSEAPKSTGVPSPSFGLPAPDAGMRPGGIPSPAERAALMRRAALDKATSPAKPGNADTSGSANPNAGGPPSQLYQADKEAAAAGTEALTPEQNALLIETQRRIFQQQGNPIGNVLPPVSGAAGEKAKQILDAAGGDSPAPQ